jgi:carbohydrate diacid regulator
MGKKLQLKSDILNILNQEIPNLVNITGGLGISYGKDRKYLPVAQKAAAHLAIEKEGNIYWVPFQIDPKTVIVCGIKSEKMPQKEKRLIEGLIAEIKFEYFLKEQVGKFNDPKSKFLKTILETSNIPDFDLAIEKGDLLGINLRSPQAVILVEIPGFLKELHTKNQRKSPNEMILGISKGCSRVVKSINAGFKNYEQNIVGCIDADRFVVLKWANGDVNTLNTVKYFKEKGEYIRKIVQKETGLGATVGVGQYYPDLAGLKKSYYEATNALELGKKIWGAGKTYHITDIGMFVSLSSTMGHEQKAELAHQILGNILTDKDLHKTVKVFLESDMNLTDAAKKLHLHRNTLIYRLDKISKEHNLNPRVFSDAVQIKLGLMLYGKGSSACKTGQSK